MIDALLTDLQPRVGALAFDAQTLLLPVQQLPAALRILRDEHAFNMLMDLTALDYWPQQQPRFHLALQLFSLSRNRRLGVRTPLDGNAPLVPTLEGIYPNANWFEREAWDMFGIRFEGSHDLRRILMPYDWEGHPLRKDYPLGYEEVQFTFNLKEIDLRKPHGVE